MARGGKREGAGRPKEVDDPELAALVRRDCKQRASVYRKQQAEGQLKREFARRGIHWGEEGEGNPVHKVLFLYRGFVTEYGLHRPTARPPDEITSEVRQRLLDLNPWKKTTGGREVHLQDLPKGERERAIREIHEKEIDNVLYAIEVIRNNRKIRDKTKLSQVQSWPLPRLSRGREKIIADVAAFYKLSERTVRKIWETPDAQSVLDDDV